MIYIEKRLMMIIAKEVINMMIIENTVEVIVQTEIKNIIRIEAQINTRIIKRIIIIGKEEIGKKVLLQLVQLKKIRNIKRKEMKKKRSLSLLHLLLFHFHFQKKSQKIKIIKNYTIIIIF